MCGRFLFTSPLDAVTRMFRITGGGGNLPPRYNIAPTQAIAVIRGPEPEMGEGEDTRFLTPMRWGLVPPFAKEIGPTPLINARAETLKAKPSFRGAYRYRRCVVPANGWYEWTGPAGAKQPWRLGAGEEADMLIGFGAIWERWMGPGGENWLESVAIVTTEAAPSIEKIHHRMPLVLDADGADAWMAEGLSGVPETTMQLSAHRVSRLINNVRNEGPACAEVERPAQGSLF